MHYREKTQAGLMHCFVRVARLLRLSAGHGFAGIVVLALSVLVSTPSSAQVRYYYDESGRLIQVTSPSGNSSQYTYDAAGNISGIKRLANTVLSVSEFTPNTGPVGTSVKILGTGFSSTAANNTVKFNNVTASVTSATATQLVVTVPSGATTGPLSVTVASTTVTSTQIFTLAAAIAAPTISNFTPTNGAAGTTVTITGRNFDTDKNNLKVSLNGELLSINTATATQITASIPADATSGKFKVTNLYGSATSSSDFYIAPPDYPIANITNRGRLNVNGTSISVSGLAANKTGQYLFDATAGQSLGLAFTSSSYSPADGGGILYIKLRQPDGKDLYFDGCPSSTYYGGVNFACALRDLPQSGTYQVFITSDADHSHNITLTLSADVAGSLSVNATTPTTFSTSRPGQNGRYTFSATAGTNYSISFSDITIDGTWTYVNVYAPDGTQINSQMLALGYEAVPLSIPNVPATGTYAIVIDPFEANTGQVKLLLQDDLVGTLTVGGATVNVNLLSGRDATFTFSGTAGQNLGLGISNLTFTQTQSIYPVILKVFSPTGELLNSCGSLSYYGVYSDESCNLSNLPATGTYRVIIDSERNIGTAFSLSLSADLTSSLAVNTPEATLFSSTTPGQYGRFTFSASAGKRYSLLVTDTTIADYPTVISVLGPDGNNLSYTSAYVSSDSPSAVFDAGVAPSTGIYTVFIDPAKANTGQLKVSVLSDAEGMLSIDGASTAISLAAGQNARYTFSGTVGQTLGLGVSALTTTPTDGNVRVSLYSPLGDQIFDCGNFSAYSGVGSCDLPRLPATGTYTLLMDPINTVAANLTLTLSSDISGVLSVGAATAKRFTTSRAGQNGRYTFSGTAGRNYSLSISNITIPGDYTYVNVLDPTGVLITQSYGSSNLPSNSINMNNVPATGTYTVFVDPYGAGTGSVDLKISNNGTTTPPNQTSNGSISIDGASLNITVPQDQTYLYTFSGTVGQRLGLGITDLSTNPPDQGIYISVYMPDNVTALPINCTVSSNQSCYLPPLPSTGTYTVRVQVFTATASLKLTLSNDKTATLTPSATTATTFSTTRPGQKGYFTFSGTAGQFLRLQSAGSTFPSTYNVTIYNPAGTYFFSAAFDAITYAVDLPVLPATGAYGVSIEPYQAQTGQTTLRLRQAVLGTVAVDGASTAWNLEGQSGRYTFNGNAGQSYGLAIKDIAITPQHGGANFSVNDPLGNLIQSCNYSVSSGQVFVCNIVKAPTSGAYTVVVNPGGDVLSASGTMILSSDITGVLPINNSSYTTFTSTRAGSNGRYTFTGNAGQAMSLAWANTNISGYWSNLHIYRPGDENPSSISGYFAAEAGRGVVDLGVLGASGTYTVVVDPFEANTGSVDLLLTQAITGSTALDALPTSISLLMGQTLEYTFNAVAGQNAGIQLTELMLSPGLLTDNPIMAELINPFGVSIKTCWLGDPGNASCKFPTFTASGIYKFRIKPGAYTANFKVQLRTTI